MARLILFRLCDRATYVKADGEVVRCTKPAGHDGRHLHLAGSGVTP